MTGRRRLAAGAIVASVLAGTAIALAQLEPTTQGTQPAVPVPPGAVAVVNGQVISEKDLTDLLVARFGRPIVEQLVLTALLNQEVARRGLTVSEAEVEALLNERIARVGGPTAFNVILRRGGVTLAYVKKYEIARDVALRKLTEKEVTVTEQDVDRAFQSAYGERRQIRRVVLDDARIANDVEKQLREGADFAEMARRRSVDPQAAQTGGLLPPIGRWSQPDDARTIEEIVFNRLKVGETSGIIGVGTRFYIIRLEAIIPARTDVKFEDVKANLREAVRQQRVLLASQRLLEDLRKKAQVGIRPDLAGE